jgi:hypothetical protein
LFPPPVRGKRADVVWGQPLQLSATLEIVDVEFIFDIALVSGHQPIVSQDRHIVQVGFFLLRNELFAKILDMDGARL